MNDLAFKFDEIGIWSELKLEIVEQYGAAYTKAFARNPRLKKYHIDGFSGAGVHVAKRTKAQVEGSPARALKVQPPFDGYCFIDLNADKTDYLRAVCGDRKVADIYTGDLNEYLTKTVLPEIQFKKFTRALCRSRQSRSAASAACSGSGSGPDGRLAVAITRAFGRSGGTHTGLCGRTTASCAARRVIPKCLPLPERKSCRGLDPKSTRRCPSTSPRGGRLVLKCGRSEASRPFG